MKSFAVFVAFVAAAVPALVSAQGPATVRGLVYSCGAGTPLAAVPVTLRSLDDGGVVRVKSDAHGRFARVGLQPGRYLISVGGVIPATAETTPMLPPIIVVSSASRLARLESDDVLDVSIGTAVVPVHTSNRTIVHGYSVASDAPRPMCDPALVPPAPSTSDRYIIH